VIRFLYWLWLQIVDACLTNRVLFRRLWTIVAKEKLVVLPLPNDAQGCRGETYTAGRYCSDLRWIELHPKHKRDPWVLAHELGHHFAGTNEANADRAGYFLLKSLLSPTEWSAIAWRAKVWLPPRPWLVELAKAERLTHRKKRLLQLAGSPNRNEAALARRFAAEIVVPAMTVLTQRASLYDRWAKVDQRRLALLYPPQFAFRFNVWMGFAANGVIQLWQKQFAKGAIFTAIAAALFLFGGKVLWFVLARFDNCKVPEAEGREIVS